MAKRTLAQVAQSIARRVDKDVNDATFQTFVEEQLKFTLNEIISEVPHAKWLLEENTITTTSAQQYVTLPTDADIDAIVSMRDESNQRRVRRISAEDADKIDPGRDLTGDEILWWYQKVGGADRIYFINRPDSVDTLLLISGELITDPTSNQTTVLPAKYEWIWADGAMRKLYPRIQDLDFAGLDRSFQKGMAIITRDANNASSQDDALASHRPGHTSGVSGASFPADYDITP